MVDNRQKDTQMPRDDKKDVDTREHSALFQKENYFVRSMATMTLVLTSVAVFLFLGSGNTGRRTAER
jgi:hypothetical protein